MIGENARKFGTWANLSRAFLLSSSAAFAFAADIGAAHAQATAGDTGLGEIIVTARKREENVLNIPVAVTAISAESLDNLGLRSIEEISTSTPSLTVARGSSGSGATLSLRGIGSTYTSIGIEQSVAVIVDGVYYGQGRIINEGFFDMSQVEVLRGPQALFFGKNATSGVLSFTSANPTDEFEAMGRVGYEFTAEATELEGVVSGPLTETLGLRIAVRAQNMGAGYVENVAPATTFTTLDRANGYAATVHNTPAPERDLPQEEDLVGRVTLRYEPNNNFSVTLKAAADRYRVSNATWNNEMFFCPLGSTQVNPGEECNGDWRIHQNDVPADVAATDSLFGRHGGRLYQDYDSYAFTSNVDYSTGSVDFSWVTGFHHFVNYFLGDYDFTGAAEGGTWGGERSEYQAFSTEFRAQSRFDGPLNFMLGGFVQATELNFDQRIIFPGGLEDSSLANQSLRYLTVTKLSETQGQTLAAFGQLLWDITPELEMALGARYTHETKDSFFIHPYVIADYQPFYVQFDPLNQATRIAADQSFNDLSPEVSLTWTPNSDWTLFASYKQGFKSGGFSGSGLYSAFSTVDDFDFEPETAEGFEAGVRVRLLDDTLRLTLDAYSYEYSDLQVDFFNAAIVAFTTYNAGSATTQGAEFSAEWAPGVAGLVLTGSLAYNDAAYDGFSGAPCWGGQEPAEGCVGGTQDLSGHSTAMAPEWTGHIGLDYETAIGDKLVFGFTGNARYSSEYFLSPFGQPDAVQDAYWSLDGAVRLGAENDRWELALIGRNLTDEYVLTSAQDAPSTPAASSPAGTNSDLVGTVNPPRTVALQFTLRY